MKKCKIFTGLILFFVVLAVASCGEGGNKVEKNIPQTETASMEVSIGGMTCLGCEQTIQRNVGKLEGIKSVKASFTIGNALIEYYPGAVDSLKIKEAITGSGYSVKKFIIAPREEITK